MRNIAIVNFLFFMFFNLSFAQNLKFFQVSNSEAVVKYDPQGNPCIVTYRYFSYDSAYKFFLIRSENGIFKTPIYIGEVKAVYPLATVYSFDFDIDTSGIVHVAVSIGDDPSELYVQKFSNFYFNSQMRVAVRLYEYTPTPPYTLVTYCQVMRTNDNNIVVNYLNYYYSNFGYHEPVIWVQLRNPDPANITPTIDSVYYYQIGGGPIFLTNKNLFTMSYGYRWTGLPQDSVYVTYSIKKVYPGGRVETIADFSGGYKRDNVPLVFPVCLPDYNDSIVVWFKFKSISESPVRFVQTLKLDRSGNLHLVDTNGVYSVYTPQNLPINYGTTPPVYQYPVVNDSMTHYYLRSRYKPSAVYLDAFNLNKAFMILRSTRSFVGSSIVYQDNGSFRYELLPLFTPPFYGYAFGRHYWVDMDNKINLFPMSYPVSEVDIDTSQGLAYIYLYPLKDLGDDFAMNYRFNEIKRIQISPVPLGRLKKVNFLKFALDNSNRMHFLLFVADSLRPTYGYFGRFYLLRQTSSGTWETSLVSNDTLGQLVDPGFTVDLNGVAHVVYSYRNRTFYTNNEGGSFKQPIIVDSAYIRYIKVKAINSNLVYIYGDNYYDNDYYYYGNYASGFRKSSRFYNGIEYLEIDNNSNLYMIVGPVILSGGRGFQFVKVYRDSVIIPGRTFFTYTRTTPADPFLFFARDKNGLLHLVGSFEGKIYYWNSSDGFNARTEYDYPGPSTKATFGLNCFIREKERRIYLVGVGASYEGAIFIGWIPYTATSVESEGQFLPSDFALHQNYPNPFNPATTISFELPLKSSVEIAIYDVLGRKVRTLVDEVMEAGRYRIQVDMSGYASGVYFYRMVAKPVGGGDKFISVKKMLLVK